jgi:hypothetical protein
VLNCPSGPGVTSVIEALRDATRYRHASLASGLGMSRLIECDDTISEYRAHLARLLGSALGARNIVKQSRAVFGSNATFRFYGDEDGLYPLGPGRKRGKRCRTDLRYSSGNCRCLRSVVCSAAAQAGGR